jgi:RNA polymerase sigma factor (sigma-70 family)
MQRPAVQQDPAYDSTTLIGAARAGDDAAWTRLMERFDRMLRAIARSYRISPAEVDDVTQIAWIRLYENIDRLCDPGAVGGWLATTVRREAMRVLQAHVRERLTDSPEPTDAVEPQGPEGELLASEARLVLGRALASLPDPQRRLMRMLLSEPDASYEEISAALRIPAGSIGPTRARAMARLERHTELRRLHARAC